ncbi:hypothetical protein KP79_PYT19381 [Mizuhopecten yessoensis]|uniref:Uncharacterized protein n=1 Tax=Mizuhopecten yessoensis TaxID=6573 RepID=A0A210QNZ0_MIZYE|nr:hypothetical protein KP79_PYT19381 [Mizuhopecten yessoensis]
MLWRSFVRSHLLTICLLVNTVAGLSIGQSGDHMTNNYRFKRANSPVPRDFNGRNVFNRKGRDMQYSPETRSNCTRNCGHRKGFQIKLNEMIHIRRLKNLIIKNLGLSTNEKGDVKTPFDTPSLTRNSNTTPKSDKKKKQHQKKETSYIRELVSFSEKAGNLSARDVLSFTIDVTNNPGPLEALSAHLWILMRKRKRKNNRGKKIFLEVLSIDDNDADYEVLTSLITRVKKTRWQKVSLPVTFIQSLLDSNTRRLRLRITCRRCGKVVRPVLFKKHKNLRKKSRRKTLKKEKRRSHQKRQAAEMRRLNRRSRRHERIPPFLVISTRYKHTVSTRM